MRAQLVRFSLIFMICLMALANDEGGGLPIGHPYFEIPKLNSEGRPVRGYPDKVCDYLSARLPEVDCFIVMDKAGYIGLQLPDGGPGQPEKTYYIDYRLAYPFSDQAQRKSDDSDDSVQRKLASEEGGSALQASWE